MSVPDSDMLISISEVLETPVSILLGETIVETKISDLEVISEKLEIINLQLAQKKIARRKIIQGLLTKTSHTPNGTCSLKIQYFS